MAKLKIAEDKRHFTRQGAPFFWVGDTVWSAFTNPTTEEWEEYLNFRKAQGFNVLQINTLPQWDRVLPDRGIYPYPRNEDDSLVYTGEPDKAYIHHARRICAMAVDKGFQLALVVNWANIVPGTWLNRLVPTHVWPLDAICRHVERVVDIYDEFDPVYIVSGDTDLETEETIACYQKTIDILKTLAPESLRTMHLCGGFTGLTQELADGLDFLMYQSGHVEGSWDTLETLPLDIQKKFPGKPILNAEPCYEAMPVLPKDGAKKCEGMYSEAEVYDACRRSILAGAVAGITYGANGLWNWNRNEIPEDIRSTAGDMYASPLFWREAMHLPAAARIAALKELAYS